MINSISIWKDTLTIGLDPNRTNTAKDYNWWAGVINEFKRKDPKAYEELSNLLAGKTMVMPKADSKKTECCGHCNCGEEEGEFVPPTKVFQWLVDIVHDAFAPEALITPKTTYKDIGLDSLDCVELIMAVEEEFNLEIPDEAAEKIESAEQLIDYLYAHGLRAPEPPKATEIKEKTLQEMVDELFPENGERRVYLDGIKLGLRHREEGFPPEYLQGDQSGADSPKHQEFIAGYIKGFGK